MPTEPTSSTRTRVIFITLLSLVLLLLVGGWWLLDTPVSSASTALERPVPPQWPYARDHVLVKFQSAGHPERGRFPGARHLFDNWYAVPVPKGENILQVIADLSEREDVLVVEPDYLVQLDDPTPIPGPNIPLHADAYPNDPYYSYQWHMPQVQSDAAWNINRGANVVVAVVDSGVSRGSDLQCRTFVSPYDTITDTAGEYAARDQNGHGTHVAGTIGQCTNNNHGTVGLAPDVKLMPVRVLDATGSGSMSDIGQGIRWAAAHGATVINMSLGLDCKGAPFNSCHDAFVDDAIAYAVEKDIVIVAAAGNSKGTTPYYPANHPDVIAVSAVDYNRQLAPYSNTGDITLSAPGGNTLVDANGDNYADGILQQTFNQYGEWGFYLLEGTSMASPHVAAAAALLRSYAPQANRIQVQQALEQTAMDLGPSGKDSTYGYGLIQAADALRYLKQHTVLTPTPTPYVWWKEAEDGTLTQPIGVGNDTNASGCTYVYVTDDWSNGNVTLNFNLPVAGEYYIWARGMGEDWPKNSFFVRIDEGEEFHFEITPADDGTWSWKWQQAPPPEEYEDPIYLSAGSHTIRFRSREQGSRLDAVLITDRADYIPTEFHRCNTTPPPPSDKRVWLPIALKIWPEPTPTQTPTPQPTPTPGGASGIYGRVTYNNQRAPGIQLNLRVYDNNGESNVATTYTDSQGNYSFKNVPNLPPGKRYYVRYGPNNSDDKFVYIWLGPDITSYQQGQSKHGGDFDIADVKLTSPPSGATRSLPVTFTWEKRVYTSDTYRFILFDPNTLQGWRTDDLGYVGDVTITALPSDVQYGKTYGWYPRPYHGENSFGIPYYYREIIFSNSLSQTTVIEREKPVKELVGNLTKRALQVDLGTISVK